MSILPQPPVKQSLFAGSAPSFIVSNPKDDFLAGFNQQKQELDTKLKEMTNGGIVSPQSQGPMTQPVSQTMVQAPTIQNQSITPKKSDMTLFADEAKARERMLADNLGEDEIIQRLKDRRKELMGGRSEMTQIELEALRKMQADGISSTEAVQRLYEHRNELGIKKQEEYDNLPLWKKAGMQGVGLVAGTLETVGSSALNLAGWTADKLGADSLGQSLKDEAKAYEQAGTDVFKTDSAYSAGYTGGNILGGTAMMLATPGAGGVVTKGTGLLSKVGAGAIDGALQTAGYDIANKGETSAESAITGAMVGGILPVVGAGVKKGYDAVSNYVTKSLPQALIAKGMTTPTALKNASERLSKLSDDGIVNIEDAPQWMLDKGLKGSKQEIQGQLQNVINSAQAQKAQMFAENTTTFGKEQIVKDLRGAIDELIPLYMKGDKPRAGAEQIVKAMRSLSKNKNPTLAQIDDMRSILGEHNLFRTTGDMADDISKKGLQKIWIDASKFVESQAPGFRLANKDIEVAMALKKAIGLKEAQDATRTLMTWPNITLGAGGGLMGYQSGGDLESTVKGVLGGAALGLGAIGLKNIANNTKVTTGTANLLTRTKLPPILKDVVVGGSKIAKKTLLPMVSSQN